MIKEKRKEKKLTQKELADAVGVNTISIYRLESGEAKIENLRFKHVIGLSRALDEPIDSFITQVESGFEK